MPSMHQYAPPAPPALGGDTSLGGNTPLGGDIALGGNAALSRNSDHVNAQKAPAALAVPTLIVDEAVYKDLVHVTARAGLPRRTVRLPGRTLLAVQNRE
jgi:hypothetical protein